MKKSFPVHKSRIAQRSGKRSVGLDAFGNAIPNVATSAVAARATRVVQVQEISTPPARKRGRGAQPKVVASDSGLLGRMVAWVRPQQTTALVATPTVEERLEMAFRGLHREFQRREQQLEERLEVVRQEQRTLAASKRRHLRWALPLAIIAALLVGYALYVLTNMQNSMVAMSGNMNQMAGDTHAMAQNIETMNRSMAGLNGNVGQMTQQVGTISQAAAPMGQAAQSFAPMTGMFKSFWPF